MVRETVRPGGRFRCGNVAEQSRRINHGITCDMIIILREKITILPTLEREFIVSGDARSKWRAHRNKRISSRGRARCHSSLPHRKSGDQENTILPIDDAFSPWGIERIGIGGVASRIVKKYHHSTTGLELGTVVLIQQNQSSTTKWNNNGGIRIRFAKNKGVGCRPHLLTGVLTGREIVDKNSCGNGPRPEEKRGACINHGERRHCCDSSQIIFRLVLLRCERTNISTLDV